MPNEVCITDFYLEKYATEEWFQNETTRQIILDTDNVMCNGMYDMNSKTFGQIDYTKLSTGTKNLIIGYNADNVTISATYCNDAGIQWLLRIGQQKDLTVDVYHKIKFPENIEFKAILLNDNRELNSVEDFNKAITDYLYK
jgi:hypothetical protein